MKRLIARATLGVAWIAVAGLLGLGSVAQGGDAGTVHYPDLVTQTPAGVKIVSVKATGKKLLKFSNGVSNIGDGRFELRPQHNGGITVAYQRLFTHDADGDWALHSEVPVGVFEYHPDHNHWHFGGFARYELRDVAPGGGIGRHVVASSDKVSWCMVDTLAANLGLEHATPTRWYVSCGDSVMQGISVGWTDIYGSNLPDQNIDITHVQTGTYWLVSTTDPDDWVAETNETNNSAAVLVTIRSSYKPKG
jgi:hypothetical protein